MVRVLIFGLDSAPPELLFSKFIDELPAIKKLLKNSIYGEMRSCIPAITIPAWAVMFTGKTPGELGLYGFRHRKAGSYDEMWIANSRKVVEPAIWDFLGMEGKKSVLIGVPPSYPPKRVNGWLISCFITPDANSNYTYPEELKKEVEKIVGEYIFDVVFRKDERMEVKEKIWEMTEKRFEVARHLIQEKDWDLFWLVEIGLDRIHHAFWKYFDKEHHLYEENSKFKNVIKDYYKLLDREIKKTLELVEEDTYVVVVSDHGVKRMKGAFAVNQWLIEEGYLKIRNPEILEKRAGVKFEELDVDWNKTVAWAWGGYYSRIFLNVEGREKNGIIKKSEYEKVREEIADHVKSIRGPNGEKWDTKVFYPEEIYPIALGDKPDLMVYFDDLYWRAAGTLGWESNYLAENDTGPDDAVHSEYGVFLLSHPEIESKRISCSIYDFAPTILKLFGIEAEFRGNALI
ncbi:type I phosphodiesterase/nucleotide pyrophosphatase [Ferroglobus placidus DSM 10642]|uniref:Type I phosphodiesterase/nucleotide pyrophosphatase n=1 Tax=Ferroglobus placidus (strain DSM 10642 / AEDII12DO) TaxID=589924 RepID=D3S247_FERPA|nr:alkaline phosphatase family protein [Ferroglobus placidus]ADC66538.1 type I phosphodiesterase/nucleotide pyrophosphatase [Ferroglobus placidus DSM 10642]